MIISKTPFRMSFFGGGTDLPMVFKENGGAVLSTTFDKYCYVNVRQLPRFFDYRTELSYSKIERVRAIGEIQHPAIREAMKMLGIEDIRLTYEADLPARSGIGTSSSFAVGMLNAFYALKGIQVDKRRLADDAIFLERKLCNEAGGWQDQIAASFGGFNRIDFYDKKYIVRPLNILEERKKRLNENLLLFFTGFSRFSSEIHDNTCATIGSKLNLLDKMLELVDKAESILTNHLISLDNLGDLLDETWMLKRQTGSKISTNYIDWLYDRAMKAGALGGKLLGAGGGGFLLFYAEKDKRERVIEELKELIYVPFYFENDGTKIIYVQPDENGNSIATEQMLLAVK